ncbi:MAG: ribosome small subunit-dependent GTPase A [Thermoleophilia bacterium]|nr:ribosome small subunit-dependent GTPase A [Gaiellaceae bacterium]MDW8339085.1 ribosome small subunit-dependent GTPase A [Thermoleophilia bacterium]
MPPLEDLGWDAGWEATFSEHRRRGLVPGRVAVVHRGAYDVLTEEGALRARLPGRVRHEASSSAERPVVGDWVALERGRATPLLRAVLPRRSRFSRRRSPDPALDPGHEQIVAANIDLVFVTAALPDPIDAPMLERTLALAWESGARPEIVLTKADLVEDVTPTRDAVAALAADIPVHVVSTRTGAGLVELRSRLGQGVTGALVGPSGVGKSSLVNALVGEERLATGEVGKGGAGRHTTTRRELVLLPSGGLLIDNPGMREAHLWLAAQGLEEAFPDVVDLFGRCRFSDCRHEVEPGCAVRAAIATGELAPERWERYRELRREITELEERLGERERARRRAGVR